MFAGVLRHLYAILSGIHVSPHYLAVIFAYSALKMPQFVGRRVEARQPLPVARRLRASVHAAGHGAAAAPWPLRAAAAPHRLQPCTRRRFLRTAV